MRGTDERSGQLFSYVDLEERVRRDHPLRVIREIANEALVALAADFSTLYSKLGRPSIAPERLLRAMLLQAFYSVRWERQLMERLDTDLLFRWFVGLAIDDPVWEDPRRPTQDEVSRRRSRWLGLRLRRSCLQSGAAAEIDRRNGRMMRHQRSMRRAYIHPALAADRSSSRFAGR